MRLSRIVFFANALCCLHGCRARRDYATLSLNLTEPAWRASPTSHCQASVHRKTHISRSERSSTQPVNAPSLLQHAIAQWRHASTFEDDANTHNSSTPKNPSTQSQDCNPVYIRLFYLVLVLLVSTLVAIPAILALLYLFRDRTREPDEEWKKEYQPWMLVLSAFVSVGKQAAVLLFVYSQICEWNPFSHRLMRDCQIQSLGVWVVPCELTKAFARCFPLIGASVSMFAAGRYALQRKIWYELIERGVLLSLTNYDAWQDPVFMLLIVDFLCGACHFLPYMFEPPYSIATDVLFRWLIPCAVFFALLERSLCTGKDLVPLPTFFEKDSNVAKDKLRDMDYKEEHILKEAAKKMHHQVPHVCNFNSIIDLLKTESESIEEMPAHFHWIHLNALAKGTWPARVLLNWNLVDDQSKEFWYAWLSLEIAFFFVNGCVVFALSASICREVGMRSIHLCFNQVELMQGLRHYVSIDNQVYMNLGKGYCRGYGMRRLYGHHQPLIEGGQELNEPGGRHCAVHCSGMASCAGFAADTDSCNIYLSTIIPAPQGWFTHNTQEPYDSIIARTNNDFEVTCWLKHPGMTGHWAGCVVYSLHLLSALGLVISYFYKLRSWRNSESFHGAAAADSFAPTKFAMALSRIAS